MTHRDQIMNHGQTVHIDVSPIVPSDSSHPAEVPVPAQEWKFMLPTEGRNPEIIGWNRLSGLSQLHVDRCVVMRGLLGHVQHRAVDNQAVQPAPIPSFVP
jgi:hypothetical protein